MENNDKKPLFQVQGLEEPFINGILEIKNEYQKIEEINARKFLTDAQIKFIDNLIIMGFDLEMIEMCFCYFKIDTLDRAIELMTKENDIWQHNYIKSEKNECIICNEYSSHIDYIIDREEKMKKMKELDDSFNDFCKESSENLRESITKFRNMAEFDSKSSNSSNYIPEEFRKNFLKRKPAFNPFSKLSGNKIEIEEESKLPFDTDSNIGSIDFKIEHETDKFEENKSNLQSSFDEKGELIGN